MRQFRNNPAILQSPIHPGTLMPAPFPLPFPLLSTCLRAVHSNWFHSRRSPSLYVVKFSNNKYIAIVIKGWNGRKEILGNLRVFTSVTYRLASQVPGGTTQQRRLWDAAWHLSVLLPKAPKLAREFEAFAFNDGTRTCIHVLKRQHPYFICTCVSFCCLSLSSFLFERRQLTPGGRELLEYCVEDRERSSLWVRLREFPFPSLSKRYERLSAQQSQPT